MNSTINIEMKLIKATSLEQFKTDNGHARMMMPYWVKIGTDCKSVPAPAAGADLQSVPETMVFNFIHTGTKKEALETMIERGQVWVQEKYSSTHK